MGASPAELARPSLLFMTSNGRGMGHLTRQLAVALAVGERADSSMLSLSLALPVVAAHRLRGEYCPSHDQPWVKGRRWHEYLHDRVVALAREEGASVLVFDGVAPFNGLIKTRAQLAKTSFVWIRRGMWRWGRTETQLAKSRLFDLVIEPGDLAAEADRGPTAGRTDAARIPPTTMLDVVDRLPREAAARALGIDPSRRTLLVTLGSGRIGQIDAPGAVVIKAALASRDWQICITTSDIATNKLPLLDARRVTELAGVYPLARYLSAFDAAVSSAGYNAVHEFIPAGIPTLFIPNPDTLTDDQMARAHHLARTGLALAADPTDEEALARATARLLDPGEGAALAAACKALSPGRTSGGAASTAALVLALARVAQPGQRLDPVERLRRRGVRAINRMLGLAGIELTGRDAARPVRKIEETPATPVRVTDDPDAATTDPLPLLFTDRISPEILRGSRPVEHVMAGSSADYRAERRRIIEQFYRVMPGGPNGERAPARAKTKANKKGKGKPKSKAAPPA